MKALYGDCYSNHLDQNVLGALRGDLGIEFEATPPYMHWLNAYAEVYMRVIKIATSVRLLQIVGKFLDDVRITDLTDMWPFGMEHARQGKCTEPSTTIENSKNRSGSAPRLTRLTRAFTSRVPNIIRCRTLLLMHLKLTLCCAPAIDSRLRDGSYFHCEFLQVYRARLARCRFR